MEKAVRGLLGIPVYVPHYSEAFSRGFVTDKEEICKVSRPWLENTSTGVEQR